VWDIDINTLISGWIIKENDGNFEFDYLKHKEYIENNVTDPSEKICKLQANEELRKDPSLIQSWLKNLWITNVDILKAVGDKDGTLIKSNVIDNYINGIGSPINAEISKQWFKAADNESRHKIIAEHDYWKQPITDADIIRYITNGLIVLKDSSLTPFINSKLINRWQKCMIGCEKVTFSTYEELLKSVRLTEWIMNHFKWRTNARNDEPFHLWVQNIWWNIQFNDGVFIDTDILRANIFHNTLEEISPNLNKNKRMYVDYLNKLWKSSLI